MTQYYQARTSSDPKVIGVDNGIQQVEISQLSTPKEGTKNEIVRFFASEAPNTDEFVEPSFQPKFPCAYPLANATLTDFLSYGPFFPSCPFIMSQAAVDSFKGFIVQNHGFYDVPIASENSSNIYHIFYCPSLSYDVLNFSSSTFYVGSNVAGKKYIKLNSFNELRELTKSNDSLIIRAEKLAFSHRFDKSLDVFSLKFGGLYFSERLVNKIKELGLSGLTFRKCPLEKSTISVINLT